MNNKVVVITGASGGIGAALAELLAASGTSLVLVARRRIVGYYDTLGADA